MSRSLARWCSLGALLGTILLAPGAHAQQAAADVLFDEGRKLMEAGRYEEAIPKMQGSHRIDPAPGTLLNLAECFVKTRRTASAWSTYRDAAALAATHGEKDRERFALDHAAALKPSLSTVTVAVPAEARAPGLSIKVNDGIVPESLYGQPFPVDPGPVRLEATAPGKAPSLANGQLPEGGGAVTFSVAPLSDVPASAPPAEVAPPVPAKDAIRAPAPVVEPEDDPGAGQKVAAYVVGAAGIVGLGIGTGLYVRAENTISDAHCPQLTCVVGVGNPALHEQGRSQERVAIGVGVASLAVVGAAVGLYFTAPKGDGSPTGLGLRVRMDADTSLVSLRGSF